MHFTEREFICQ